MVSVHLMTFSVLQPSATCLFQVTYAERHNSVEVPAALEAVIIHNNNLLVTKTGPDEYAGSYSFVLYRFNSAIVHVQCIICQAIAECRAMLLLPSQGYEQLQTVCKTCMMCVTSADYIQCWVFQTCTCFVTKCMFHSKITILTM